MTAMLQAFKEKLQGAMESPEQASLFTSEIVETADQLAESLTLPPAEDDMVSIESVHWIGYFHYLRYRALKSGEDLTELVTSLSWFGLLASVRPDLVPSGIAAVVKVRTNAEAPAEPTSFVESQTQALREAMGTGDLSKLDSAAASASAAQEQFTGPIEERARALAMVGSAYRTFARLFEGHGVLEESIPWARRAVILTAGTEFELEFLQFLASSLWELHQSSNDRAVLFECEQLGRRLAAWPGQVGEDAAEADSHLAVVLKLKYEATNEAPVLMEAIEFCQLAVDNVDRGSPTRARHLSNLCEGLWTVYNLSGKVEDLDRVIDNYQESLLATAAQVEESEHYFWNFSTVLREKVESFGDRAAYRQWVDVAKYAVAASPTGRDRARSYLRLAKGLRELAIIAGEQVPHAEHIKMIRNAVAEDPHPELKDLLAGALREGFEDGGPRGDIDEAVDILRQLVEQDHADSESYPMHLQNLAGALSVRYGHSNDRSDIDQSIRLGYDALMALRSDSNETATFQMYIADRLRARASANETPIVDLNTAIALYRESYANAGNDPIILRIISGLRSAQIDLYKVTGDTRNLDFDAADKRLESILSSASSDQRISYISNLATDLRDRFEALGRTGDINRSIKLYRSVLATKNTSDRPQYSAYLAAFLRTRYKRLGDKSDIDEAIQLFSAAANSPTLSDFERARQYAHLGGAFVERFERFARLADLDEGVAASRSAVKLSSREDHSYYHHLSHLALTLSARADFRGGIEDLEECEAVYIEAANCADSDSDRADMVYNAGTIIARRARALDDPTLLDSSIALLRKSLAILPSGSDKKPLYLSMIGSRFMERYIMTGLQSDINEAIATCRRSVDECRPSHPNFFLCRANLAATLGAKASNIPSGRVQSEATAIYRQLLEGMPENDPARIRIHGNLAVLLQAAAGNSEEARNEAIELYRTYSESPLITAAQRLSASMSLAQLLAVDNHRASLEIYRRAVSLVPLAAWHGIRRTEREHHLRRWTGLGAAAAEVALSLDEPGTALELLEGSRSVMWQQLLEQRVDLSSMTGIPEDIVRRMIEIRASLDA